MSCDLLVESHVRDFVFAVIREKRAGLVKKMTRVSEDFYIKIDSRLRVRICADARLADGGEHKTLRPAQEGLRPDGTPWLINQSNVRDFFKKAINETSLVQVSASYMDYCDDYVRAVITTHIQSMSSAGKTVT